MLQSLIGKGCGERLPVLPRPVIVDLFDDAVPLNMETLGALLCVNELAVAVVTFTHDIKSAHSVSDVVLTQLDQLSNGAACVRVDHLMGLQKGDFSITREQYYRL